MADKNKENDPIMTPMYYDFCKTNGHPDCCFKKGCRAEFAYDPRTKHEWYLGKCCT